MKFLWINNVASILGGTLNATLSMVCSLPDADHTVFSFSNRFGPEEYGAFPKEVKLVSGSNLSDFIRDKKFDVIVFQNTSFELMPSTYVNRPLLVYYQHSHHRSAKQAREKCDITFCVSEYLADLAGLDCENVLYQPVTIPPRVQDKDFGEWADGEIILGRICTPNPSKWNSPEVIELYSRLTTMSYKVHLIGATDPVKEHFRDNPNVYFSPPSFYARTYLRYWKCLVYQSSLKETYGRTVKEAQRSGCIPIVSNQGGFREQIEHGVSGFLCDTTNDFIDCVSEYHTIKKEEMKRLADMQGSLKIFRDNFLRRLLK